MTRDSWILGLAGVAFGILIGWIIGSQSARPSSAAAFAAQQQSAGAPQQGQQGQPGSRGRRDAGGAPSGVQAPPPLDEAQAKALAERAAARPKDAEVRAQLGNLYFDAERYGDAIKWYEASLALDAEERERQHRSRGQLLLHESARSGAQAVRDVARDRSPSHQDHVESRHGEGVRQTGSARRRAGLEAGARHRAARQSRSARGASGARKPPGGASRSVRRRRRGAWRGAGEQAGQPAPKGGA